MLARVLEVLQLGLLVRLDYLLDLHGAAVLDGDKSGLAQVSGVGNAAVHPLRHGGSLPREIRDVLVVPEGTVPVDVDHVSAAEKSIVFCNRDQRYMHQPWIARRDKRGGRLPS